MLKPLTSLALAVGLTLGAGPALADPAPKMKKGNETIKKYCTGDYLTYCGNLAPEDPALEQCFEKNWDKLSENCRRAIDAYAGSGAGKKGK
ncbi:MULTISPECIES: 3',5'-cyclic-nucleotide phosphodiesterase [Methylobacterium]|uniref:3',5'-cyclic-nucleotide phosphodiesterase n=1 Tax=Methylobacterium jeotgali TaxID=381630 RepID=A0ABQ4SW20_9HYPH|nr:MULTISPECIES: 3',5'-cyclic-nucleotide phosphodiesterase [Methylobacterium]PIU06829.1 MAG: 3',5'-cyclic-nucleotide phosphodiesterase [Methylobacterium sp. CG09_land_8_20_14_0_10_71_15]PIU13837.1 MAG: 3',5'-cyclic-nucleotide phosphodiesterase [Methylobacterium sp. CG08_land_8_20_14_0_20_71_15]GBU16165.1 hypothetical protein AwMethylo_03800 [Methylobacterium sp.]GJE05901.1 hypothetical protein AOPFMNJM_1207 [Methylobacterium jeotgali]